MTLRNSPHWTAVLGGVVAGALDIVYAWVYWAIKAGVTFERILQSVASGLLGPASFRGGARSALLGALLHFGIAIAMSLTYYGIVRRIARFRHRPLIYGPIYGLALFIVMRYIVVPLSAAGGSSGDPLWVSLTIAAHMFLVGLPIALFANRALHGD